MVDRCAAFRGTYSDMKFLKGRRVCQIVLEVPLEEGASIVEAFGTPNPASEVWVGFARLQDGEGPPRRPVPEKLSPAVMDAAIVCREPEFWNYLEKVRSCPVDGEKQAAAYVRAWCGVASRSDIKPGSGAERLWGRLFLDYSSKREKAHE